MARPLSALKRAAARALRRGRLPRGRGAPSTGGAQSQWMQALQGAEAARRLAWRTGTIQGVERGPGGRFISGAGPEVVPGGGRAGGFGGRAMRPQAAGAPGGPASAGGLAQAGVPGGTTGAVAVRTAGRPSVDTTGYLPGSIPSPTPEDPTAQRWTMPRAVRQNIERIVSQFDPAGGPDGFRNRDAARSHLATRSRTRRQKLSKAQQDTIRDFSQDEGTYYQIKDALEADAGTPIAPLRGVAQNRRTPGGGASAKYLRAGGDPENPDDYRDVPGREIKNLDDSMAPLEDDLILNYTTGPQAFGVTPETIDDIDTWLGRRIILSKNYRRAKVGSFTSINDLVAEGKPGPYVKVSMLAPKGTRAVIPGDGSDEITVDRETAARVSNITRDPDGNVIVWGTIEPRREFTEAPIGTGRLPARRGDRERRMGSLVRPRTPRRELTSAERQALEGLKAGHTPRSLRQLQREGVITAAERRALEAFDETSAPRQPLRNLLSKLDRGELQPEPRAERAAREVAARAETAVREVTAAKAVRKAAKARKVTAKAARASAEARRSEILTARAGRKPKETAQPGRIISYIDEGGRKRSGRIVSRDDDGLLTVSWKETPGPDGRSAETEPLVDSADSKYRISAPPRRTVTRTPRVTTAEPRELEAGTQIPPRADHTIFEYDPETGQLLRTGRVGKRERNQDIQVTWDDGELGTIPKNPATEDGPEWGSFRRFKFETAAQRRTRERTTPLTTRDLAEKTGIGADLVPPEERLSRQSEGPGSLRSSLRRLRTSPEGEALPEAMRRKLLQLPKDDAEAAREGRIGWTAADRRAVTDAARMQYLREAQEARERWRATVDALEQGAQRLQARREGPKKPTKVTREAARKALQDNSVRAMKDPDGLVADLRAAVPDARSGMLNLGGRRAPYERVLKAAGVEPKKQWSIPELTRQILRALGGEAEAPRARPAVKVAKSTGRKVTAPSAPEAPTPPVKAARPAVKRAAGAVEPAEALPRLRAAETPEAQREILEGLSPRLKGPYQAIARDLDIQHDVRTTRAQLIERIAGRLAGGEAPAPPTKRVIKRTAPEAEAPPTRAVKAAGRKAAKAAEPAAEVDDEAIADLLPRAAERARLGGRSLRRPRTLTDEDRALQRDVDDLLRETRATNLVDPKSRDVVRDARSRLAAGEDAEDIVRRLDDAVADVLKRTVSTPDTDNPNLERLAREAGLPDDPDGLRKLARSTGGVLHQPREIQVENALRRAYRAQVASDEKAGKAPSEFVSLSDIRRRLDATDIPQTEQDTVLRAMSRQKGVRVVKDGLSIQDPSRRQVPSTRFFRGPESVDVSEATPNELRALILGRRRADVEFLRDLASRIRRDLGIPEPARKAVKKAAVKKVAAKAVKAAAPEAPVKKAVKAVKKAAPEAPAPVKKAVKAAVKKAVAAPEAPVPVKKAAPAVKKAAPAKAIRRGPAGLDLSDQELADYQALPTPGARTRYTLVRKNRGFTHAEAIQYAGGPAPAVKAVKKAAPAKAAAPEALAPVKKAVKRAVKAAAPEAPTPVKKAVKRGADTEAPIDPFATLSETDEAGLRRALEQVDIDGLRSVIRRNGMDPGRQLSRTKDKQRLIDRIVELTKSRSTKGDAFRAPSVKRAAPAKQVQEARQEAGDASAFRPGRQATEALIPNERIRGSNVHESGPVRHIMALSDDEKRWDIGDDKAFGNEVVRAISQEAAGELTAQQLADSLASMRDRLPVNSRARQVLRAILDEMGAHKPHPDDPRPHMPADTPPFLRRLLDDFFDNPLTRDPLPVGNRGREGYRSDFLRAVDLVARWDAGQISALRMEEELRKLDNTHHESVIGFYDQRRAVRRAVDALKALTPEQRRSLFRRTAPRVSEPAGVPQPAVRPGGRVIRPPASGTAPGTSTPPTTPSRLEIRQWMAPPAFDIRRDADGAITGDMVGHYLSDRVLTADTGDVGIPIRNLRLSGDGYTISRGTAWRIDGTTYIAEHTSTPGSIERARGWRDDMRRWKATLPAETRGLVRGQALMLGESPNTEDYRRLSGDPTGLISMQTNGAVGTITTWNGGKQFQRPDVTRLDQVTQYDHEFGHIIGFATGNIGQEGSPEYKRVVEAGASRAFSDWTFTNRPGSREVAGLVDVLSGWRTRHTKTRPDGTPIVIPNGSTPYGQSGWGESIAEDFALYRMGRIGTFRSPEGVERPAYFRDFFPERAAYFDRFMPSIQAEQLGDIARSSGPLARARVKVTPRPVVRVPQLAEAAPAPGRVVRRSGPASMTDAQREEYSQLPTPQAKSKYTRAINKGADHATAMAEARAVTARPAVTRAVPAKKAVPGEAPAKAAGRVVRRPGPAGMTDDERVDYDKLPNAASKAAYTNARKTMDHDAALERAEQKALGRPAVKRAGRQPVQKEQGQRIQEAMDRLGNIMVPDSEDDDVAREITDAVLTDRESPEALKGVNLQRYLRWRSGEALTPAEETGLRTKLSKLAKEREDRYERVLSVEVISPSQVRENITRERQIQQLEDRLIRGDLPSEEEDSAVAELAELRSRSRSAPGFGDPVTENARLRDWLAVDVDQTQRRLAREDLSPAERRKLEKHLTRTSRMLRQEAQRVGFSGDERVNKLETAQRRISDRVVAAARQARIDRYTEQGFPPANDKQRDNAAAVLRAYRQRGLAQEVIDDDLPPRLARKQLRDTAKQQKRDAASLLEETARLQAEGSLRPNQLRDRIREHQQLLRDAEIRTQLAKDITKSQQKNYQFKESALLGTKIEHRVPAATASPGPNDVPEEDDVVYLGRRGYGRVLDVGPTIKDKQGHLRTPVTVQREGAARLVTVDREDLALVRKGNWDLDRERLTRQLGRRYPDLATAEADRIDDRARALFRDRIASAREGGELNTAEGRRLTRIVPPAKKAAEPRKIVRRGPERPPIQPELPSEEATARRLADVRAEMEREPTRAEMQEFERVIRTLTGRPWSEVQNDPEAMQRLRADERLRSNDVWNIVQRANMTRPVVGFAGIPRKGTGRPTKVQLPGAETPTPRPAVKRATKGVAPATPAAPVKKVAKAAVKAAAPIKVTKKAAVPVKAAKAPAKVVRKAAAPELSPERRVRIDEDGRKAAVKFVGNLEENIVKGASVKAIDLLVESQLRKLGVEEVDGRFIAHRRSGNIDLSRPARSSDAPDIKWARLLTGLASDVDTGDREGTLKRLRARMIRAGMKPVGRAGDVIAYSPDEHEPVSRMPKGTPARVVRPGYVWKSPDGKQVKIADPLVDEEIQSTAPATKAARKVARKAVAPELTPKQIYDMKLPEARRVAREAFPDLPENASRAMIVDRFTPDRPRVTSPEAETPEVTRLRQLVEAADLVETGQLKESATARVARLRAPDGTRVVSKRTIPDPRYVEDADAASRTDAEYLSARLGRAMGADVPAAFSPSDRTTFLEDVSGRSATRLTPEELADLVATPGGRRLAILSLATGNTDGHTGNFIRSSDGRLVGIDFSGAFKTNLDRRVGRELAPAPMHQDDPFRSLGAVVSNFDERGVSLGTDEWADQVPFTASELRAARRALQELKPEFERLGRGDWYRAANGRIGAMLKRAAPAETPAPRKVVKKAAPAKAVKATETAVTPNILGRPGTKVEASRRRVLEAIAAEEGITTSRARASKADVEYLKAKGLISTKRVKDLQPVGQWWETYSTELRLTDAGRRVLGETPEAPTPQKVVKKAAATAKKAGKRAAPDTTDLTGARGLSADSTVREIQIENRIRQAYEQVPQLEGGGVTLRQIRPLLNDLPQAEVDGVLVRLGRERGSSLTPIEGGDILSRATGQRLSPEELRPTGVTVGGERMVFLRITDPSLRPLPAKAAKKVPTPEVKAPPVKKVRAPQRPALEQEAREAGVKNISKKNMERLRASLARRRTQPAETTTEESVPEPESDAATRIIPGTTSTRQYDLREISNQNGVELPEDELAKWQRQLDAGEDPESVAADMRKWAQDALEAFQVKHRDFLVNENVRGSREIDAERAQIANVARGADLLESEGDLLSDPNAPGPPASRPRVVRPPRDVTPETEPEEEEPEKPRRTIWERILRRWTGDALDDEELGRPGGKKRRREKGVARLIGGPNGDAFGPDGIPHAPGGGGAGASGAAGGADEAVEDAAQTALGRLRGRVRSRNLPNANDFGDTDPGTPELPAGTRASQVAPRLRPRPTSGIRGTRRSPQESGTGAIPAELRGLGPEMADVPISGSGSGPTRVGRQLSPDLEQLLDNLRYDNAGSIAGQLRAADLEPAQINALSRRMGVAPSLVGLRGKDKRLGALAEALAQAAQQTPVRVTEAPQAIGMSGRRVIRRGRRAPVPLPDDADEDALEEMERRLANARRRLRRAGGPTGTSTPGAMSDLETEADELAPTVQAARARINPSPNFWRQREVAQALVDDGLTPTEARRATGMVPEQVPLATVSLPAEATGMRLRVRRPAAVEQPRTLDIPAGEPGPPMEAVFEPPARGAISGVPGDPILGPQDLNELGGDSVLAAYRAGRARSGPAADRLDKLAEEMEQGARSLNQPDRAIQQAEARRLQSAANNIRSGVTVSGSDGPVAGQPGGGGLVPLSATDIRDVLSKLQTVDQARNYLRSLHFSESGLRALAGSLGLPVREAMGSSEILELIAGSVQK